MPKFNVLMVGGKRCGKTTVLASLDRQANKVFKGAMTLDKAQGEMVSDLQDKVSEMQDIFIDAEPQDFFHPDDLPNKSIENYEFSLKITGKNSTGISLCFTDVPGEGFVVGNIFNQEIKEKIEHSDVLIIAIDTPFMMEEKNDRLGYGVRHMQANRSSEITQFIKSRLDIQKIQNHLILFVPLKCEKYYYRNQLSEVAETVKKAYADLIRFFASPNLKDNCTVAITPILSVGGFEFFDFDDGYIFRSKEEERRYNPKYSEQPLIYMLAYILKLLENQNYRGGIGAKILSWFIDEWVTLQDIKNGLEDATKSIIKDEKLGFVILQNPFDI